MRYQKTLDCSRALFLVIILYPYLTMAGNFWLFLGFPQGAWLSMLFFEHHQPQWFQRGKYNQYFLKNHIS